MTKDIIADTAIRLVKTQLRLFEAQSNHGKAPSSTSFHKHLADLSEVHSATAALVDVERLLHTQVKEYEEEKVKQLLRDGAQWTPEMEGQDNAK